MHKGLIYRNVKHILADMPFLDKVLEEGFSFPDDMIQVSVQITQNGTLGSKTSIKLIQEKTDTNRIVLKPSVDSTACVEMPVFQGKFMKAEEVIRMQIEKLQPKQSNQPSLWDFFTFTLLLDEQVRVYKSQMKAPIKISLVDTQFLFINTEKLKEICSRECRRQEGVLGFDENYRLVVYGDKSAYPVVGIWSTGLEIGDIFLKNSLNDQVKQVLWLMMMRFACSECYTKVSFHQGRFKFLYIPFSQRGGVPSVFLVEMGNLGDTVTTQVQEQPLIHESIPIKNSNFQLWETFLNKDSLKPQEDRLTAFEIRLQAITQGFLQIQAVLNDERNASNEQEQQEQLTNQQQRLLLHNSSKQVFTARSGGITSNRFSQNSLQHKFSSFKKLKNSIYDTLEQNNKWLSTEGKNLSVEKPLHREVHHDVSSFFKDLPQST